MFQFQVIKIQEHVVNIGLSTSIQTAHHTSIHIQSALIISLQELSLVVYLHCVSKSMLQLYYFYKYTHLI